MELHFTTRPEAFTLRPLFRLILINIIIMSSQFFILLPCAASGHLDNVSIRSSNERITANSLRYYHDRNISRYPLSRYVLRSSQSRPKEGGNAPRLHVNLRKLAAGFGCISNPSMCLTVPGWTSASNASTCCSNGVCTDTQFDSLNCGACAMACSFGYSCCSRVCVATGIDPRNCGRCGNVCKGGVCGFGFCNY